MKRLINKINRLLIAKYGVPNRNNSATDPVDALIATILSQNTNDKNSYKAYMKLKTNYKNWNEVALSNQRTIEQNIRIGGLAKQKSKAIIIILKELLEKRGKITLDYLDKLSSDEVLNELVKFNGVGVKTASCVMLFSLKRNVCPVDTHVHRILNRIGLVKTSTPDQTFELINNNLPERTAHSFHTNLIRLGRDICKASNPNCSICPLIKICSYKGKNLKSISKLTKNDFLLLDNV